MAGFSGFGADFNALGRPDTIYLKSGTEVVQGALILTAIPMQALRFLMPSLFQRAFAGAVAAWLRTSVSL